MSNVIVGEGTLLGFKAGNTGSYVNVGQVITIEGPEVTVAAVDKTALADTLKKSRPSRQPDPGELTFHLNVDPDDATHILILGRVDAPTATDDGWQLTFNSADVTAKPTAAFTGFVTAAKYTGMESESNLGLDVTVKVNSVITRTAGTP